MGRDLNTGERFGNDELPGSKTLERVFGLEPSQAEPTTLYVRGNPGGEMSTSEAPVEAKWIVDLEAATLWATKWVQRGYRIVTFQFNTGSYLVVVAQDTKPVAMDEEPAAPEQVIGWGRSPRW